MKRIAPGKCCLATFITLLVFGVCSEVAFSLKIGNCNLSFSESKVASFLQCLCKDNAKTCNNSCYSLFTKPLKSGETIPEVGPEGTSTYSYFLCEAQCTRKLSPPGILCQRKSQRVRGEINCRNNRCYFFNTQKFGGCSKKCIGSVWVSVDEIEVPKCVLYLMQPCVIQHPPTTIISTTIPNLMTPTSTLDTSNLSFPENISAASTEDPKLFSRTISNLLYLIVIIGVLPLVIIIIVVLVKRKRITRSLYTPESKENIYITPIEAVYNVQEPSDDQEGNVLNVVYRDECKYVSLWRDSISMENRSKSNYMNIDSYASDEASGQYANYPMTQEGTILAINNKSAAPRSSLAGSTIIDYVCMCATKDGPYSTIDDVAYATNNSPYETLNEIPCSSMNDVHYETPCSSMNDVPYETPCSSMNDVPYEIPCSSMNDVHYETPCSSMNDVPYETLNEIPCSKINSHHYFNMN